ncbi:hypothetical protein V5O48_007231 [Marasmius crinis-equi]|uniref:Uncharacterized protein n=1 Tax=Marasmius crinis-equi TaxID=585013 RepID=A0ABR3FHN7_9AGAR
MNYTHTKDDTYPHSGSNSTAPASPSSENLETYHNKFMIRGIDLLYAFRDWYTPEMQRAEVQKRVDFLRSRRDIPSELVPGDYVLYFWKNYYRTSDAIDEVDDSLKALVDDLHNGNVPSKALLDIINDLFPSESESESNSSNSDEATSSAPTSAVATPVSFDEDIALPEPMSDEDFNIVTGSHCGLLPDPITCSEVKPFNFDFDSAPREPSSGPARRTRGLVDKTSNFPYKLNKNVGKCRETVPEGRLFAMLKPLQRA